MQEQNKERKTAINNK